MNGHPAKEKLRSEVRARLSAMSPALHAEASLVICQGAANLPAFVKSRCVALFAPLPLEPDIHPLIEEAWAQGKRVVLPLMIKRGSTPELDWHRVARWDEVVVKGPFGLREPDPLRCPASRSRNSIASSCRAWPSTRKVSGLDAAAASMTVFSA